MKTYKIIILAGVLIELSTQSLSAQEVPTLPTGRHTAGRHVVIKT